MPTEKPVPTHSLSLHQKVRGLSRGRGCLKWRKGGEARGRKRDVKARKLASAAGWKRKVKIKWGGGGEEGKLEGREKLKNAAR